MNQRECPICGIKFVEFRNTGRLGCPHDYEEFREELAAAAGEHPRRDAPLRQDAAPAAAEQADAVGTDPASQALLKQAVNKEAYEEAARLRDRIKTLEES